jgi:hypothetical protein
MWLPWVDKVPLLQKGRSMPAAGAELHAWLSEWKLPLTFRPLRPPPRPPCSLQNQRDSAIFRPLPATKFFQSSSTENTAVLHWSEPSETEVDFVWSRPATNRRAAGDLPPSDVGVGLRLGGSIDRPFLHLFLIEILVEFCSSSETRVRTISSFSFVVTHQHDATIESLFYAGTHKLGHV